MYYTYTSEQKYRTPLLAHMSLKNGKVSSNKKEKKNRKTLNLNVKLTMFQHHIENLTSKSNVVYTNLFFFCLVRNVISFIRTCHKIVNSLKQHKVNFYFPKQNQTNKLTCSSKKKKEFFCFLQ